MLGIDLLHDGDLVSLVHDDQVFSLLETTLESSLKNVVFAQNWGIEKQLIPQLENVGVEFQQGLETHELVSRQMMRVSLAMVNQLALVWLG